MHIPGQPIGPTYFPDKFTASVKTSVTSEQFQELVARVKGLSGTKHVYAQTRRVRYIMIDIEDPARLDELMESVGRMEGVESVSKSPIRRPC